MLGPADQDWTIAYWTQEQQLSHCGDDELLQRYDKIQSKALIYQEAAGRLEQEIMRRMEDRTAIAIPSETFICELKVGHTYNQAAFIPLKEMFNDKDLKSCCTPAHEETTQVEEKWDTRKVMSLARRYGKDALAIVEQAKTPTKRSLDFKEREQEES